MDADLVEKITRMVLSKLEEYSVPPNLKGNNTWNDQTSSLNESPEYPPLSEEDLKKWSDIASTIGFSKRTEEVPFHLMPLKKEELRIWNELSASIGFRSDAPSVKEKQSDYLPLTEEEVKSWSQLGVPKPVYSVKEKNNGRVKFFPHN
ncbi:hypothetical protein ACIQXV_11360 [Neobacillus sp. NPDC097160]|uniref:hypothetical protein n=1 Tax=Neobacillus sp. NPDC097160 TaxID=3364298 RepID=UPI00382A5FEA